MLFLSRPTPIFWIRNYDNDTKNLRRKKLKVSVCLFLFCLYRWHRTEIINVFRRTRAVLDLLYNMTRKHLQVSRRHLSFFYPSSSTIDRIQNILTNYSFLLKNIRCLQPGFLYYMVCLRIQLRHWIPKPPQKEKRRKSQRVSAENADRISWRRWD